MVKKTKRATKKRTPKPKVKNPVGRPPKEFNIELAERLAHIQCTQDEIAAAFDMTEVTLDTKLKEHNYVNFLDFYKTNGAGGKRSVRRNQFKIMEGGNSTMAIWLGKQLLGQSDNPVHGNEDTATPFVFKQAEPKDDE